MNTTEISAEPSDLNTPQKGEDSSEPPLEFWLGNNERCKLLLPHHWNKEQLD
jgi:hypothetical protein